MAVHGGSLPGLLARCAGLVCSVFPGSAAAVESQVVSQAGQEGKLLAAASPQMVEGDEPGQWSLGHSDSSSVWMGRKGLLRGGGKGAGDLSVLLQILQGAVAEDLGQGTE